MISAAAAGRHATRPVARQRRLPGHQATGHAESAAGMPTLSPILFPIDELDCFSERTECSMPGAASLRFRHEHGILFASPAAPPQPPSFY